MQKCALISIYKSLDIAPNILYTILFIVNCNGFASVCAGITPESFTKQSIHFTLIGARAKTAERGILTERAFDVIEMGI